MAWASRQDMKQEMANFVNSVPRRNTNAYEGEEVKTVKTGLTFWEQELIENDRRRQLNFVAETATSSEEPQDRMVVDETRVQIKSQERPEPHPIAQSTAEPEDTASSDFDQIVYLPKGHRTADTDIDGEEYESDSEPMSSSHELVGRFCLWSHVAKFVYKYMDDPQGHVSRQFFSKEKIFQRNWNMHYLFGPDSPKPLILVPLAQVQLLVNEIAKEFQIYVGVPEYPFQIAFYNDGTPNPTLLGLVNSKADMNGVQNNIQYPSEHYGRLPSQPTATQVQDYDAWAEKVEGALNAGKKKRGGKKKKKAERRQWLVREDADSLHRAQRYLGLRPELNREEVIHSDAPSNVDQPRTTQHNASSTDILDLTQLVPFPFKDDAVIITVDVELWEKDHDSITEIGISTLDTADIKAIAPGNQGEEWIKKIRSRHLRIKGRERLFNYQYVNGCPDMFQFGSSEFVTLDEAPGVVDSCFEHPHSAGFECEGPSDTDDNGVIVPRQSTIPVHEKDHASDLNTPRNLLLVGHDISHDLTYLSKLGSDIFGSKPQTSADSNPSRRQRVLSSIRENLDTAILYKILNKDQQTRSLGRVCAELDIMTPFTHNAGNDARYTLEAFVKMVVKSRRVNDGVVSITRDLDDVKTDKVSVTGPGTLAVNGNTVQEPGAHNVDAALSQQMSNYTPFVQPDVETSIINLDDQDPDDQSNRSESGESESSVIPY